MQTQLRMLVLMAFLLSIGQNSFAQSAIVTLDKTNAIESELKGGEKHVYQVDIPANQFVYVVTEQKGIDVAVTLVGPDATILREVDSPNGSKGPEPMWYVTTAAGKYQIEVRSLEADAKPGRYEIRVVEIRPATVDDAIFLKGQKAKADGDLLMADDNDESAGKAFTKYEEAARQYRLIGDVRRKAALIRELGNYGSNRKLEISVGYYQEALNAYVSAGMKQLAAETLLDIGSAFDDLQRYTDELDAYQKALGLAVEIDGKALQAKICNKLGVGHARLGDFNQSLEDFRQALKLSEGLPWTSETSVTLMGLGNVYNALGNVTRALEYEHNNIALLETNGEKNGVPAQLLNIGNVYLGQGNCSQALVYYQRALAGFQIGRAPVGRSYALANVGNAYGCLGKYADALDYIERSRVLKTKFMPKDPGTLSDIARIYRLQGEYDKALENYQKSLDIYLEINGLDFAASVTEAMAEVYYLQGSYVKSLEFADKATALEKQLNYPFAWNSLTTAGMAHNSIGQLEEARKDLEAAVIKIEGLRPQILGGLSEPENYLDKLAVPFKVLVDVSISERKIPEALMYAERSRARALLNVLQTNKTQISRSMTQAELDKERSIRNEIASLNKQTTAETEKSRLGDLDQRLQKKRLEFEDFQTNIYSKYPGLRVQRGEMTPIRHDEAVDLLHDSTNVFLEFVVTDDKIIELVIKTDSTAMNTISAHPIKIAQKDLLTRVEAYRSKMAAGSLDFQTASRQLYDLLLKPASAELAGKTNIVIIPDGPLWNLPFQALMDENGKFLAEKMALSYAPSLTALREMRKKAKERPPLKDSELVAFGNPVVAKETSERVQRVFMGEKLEPLPEAERMVSTLAKMYGPARSKVYTGAAAREETAKSEAPKYRIVQFATHGLLNDVSPMYSHLVLAQDETDPNEDGLLEAWELKDLDLKADMVILSACDTARGRVSAGEGIIGMTWAAFIAGAPTTVASQWKVESTSTTELMIEFHRQLLTGKVSKAEALRRAQLKLMRNPKYKHPSYWAAWVIVGDAS
jgi:CHAT domain-containing protein